MAHFVRTRAGGTWTNGTDLLPSEVEDFDAKLFASVNGDAGGTWAPSSQIVYGGSGLSVTGPSAFSNITAATLNGTLTVASGAFVTFASGASMAMLNGAVATMAGNSLLSLSGTASIALTGSSTLSTTSATTTALNGPITLGATSTITYDPACTVAYGGHTASGTLTRTGQTILSGSSGGIGWRSTTLSDATQTVDGGAFDLIYVPGALTAVRAFSLLVPTGNVKARAKFLRPTASGSNGAIVSNNGVTLYTMGTSGSPWCEVFFNGSNWVAVAFGTGV